MVCNKCKKDKTPEFFHKHRKRCKECYNKHYSGEGGRSTKYKIRYGITIEQYNEMYKTQGGKCKICLTSNPGKKRVKNFTVDHCHETKKVRGLLCYSCNIALGHIKDNPKTLKKMIKYLK